MNLKMNQISVALIFFGAAALAQDTGIDWYNIKPAVFPAKIPSRFALRDKTVPESRIVGGDLALRGEFSYQAALIIDGQTFCGGSIISDEWIMTAAHCADTAKEIIALLGALNIVDDEADRFNVPVEKIVVHENWNRANVNNDIALLQLSEKLTFSDVVKPVKLAQNLETEDNSFANRLGIVAGWGKDSDASTSISPFLRWTTNLILSNSECSVSWPSRISSTRICLDGAQGRAACNGDSGGALVIQDTDEDGNTEYTQVGIVSFGSIYGCESGIPGVYTRVSEYSEWIEETMQ